MDELDKNKKILQLFEVIELFKPESDNWHDIGDNLKLSDDVLNYLGNDNKSSNYNKLSKMLTKWFESQDPNNVVSFNQLKDVLEHLNYNEKAEKLLSKVLSDNELTPNSTEVTLNQELIDLRRKEIEATIRVHANDECHGIILIVSGYNIYGAEIDVPNIESVFKKLNFATYTALRNTTRVEEIACLIQAVADIKYPRSYQYVAFYFSGIGGLGKKDKKMFLMGKWIKNESDEVIYIEDYVINPLKRLDEQQISRLFLIESSRTEINDGTHLFCVPIKEVYHPNSNRSTSLSGEIVAYAASDGQGSLGDETQGSIWTNYLCNNLYKMKDKSITAILEKTSDEVANKKGVTIQKPFIKRNTIPAAKLTKGTRSFSVQENEYVEDFQRSFENKKLVSYVMVQVIPFGPPRVGKTCLYRRLLDQEPYSQRTTCNKSGKGSLSTSVLAERKIVQMVKNEESRAIVAGEAGGKWNEISGLEDQIAICMKTTRVQLHQQSAEESHHQNISSSPAILDDQQTPPVHSDTSRAKDQLAKTSNDANSDRNGVTDEVPVSNPDKTNDVPCDFTAPEQAEKESSGLKIIIDSIKSSKTVDFDNVKALDDSLMIYFTDTGGQPEFHEILPALVAGPTVFLLAFSLHESLDSLYEVDYESASVDFKKYHNSFTVKEVLMGCLSSISCFKAAQAQDLSNQTSSNSQLSEPPISVLIVGTHYDLVSKEKLLEFNRSLYNELGSSKLFYEVIEQFDSDERQLLIPIDNFNFEDGVKLRKFFNRIIYNPRSKINPFKITLPVNWLGFELSLKILKKSTIKYDDCLKLKDEFHMDSEEELQSCLRFLHYKTGTIRYYSSINELKDTVIIKPQVIFAAVTSFITSTFSSSNVSYKAADDFKYYGLFKKQDVKTVFNSHKDSLEITFAQFIALLKHLNILSEWHDNDENEDRFFFPCALSHIAERKEVIANSDTVYDPLLVSFDSGFLPKGVFSGILAKASQTWRISKIDYKPVLHRNRATFYLTNNNSTITIKATAKYLEISQECSKDDNPNEVSMKILCTLSDAIKDVCSKLGYGNKFCSWKFGFYCCTSLTPCQASAERHFAGISENDRFICSRTAKKFEFGDRQHWLEGIRSYGPDIGERMDQENKARIKNCVHEYKNAQGIIFIIRMFGPPETTENVEKIHLTFRRLNFAVLRFSDPTSVAITNLMTAAGSFCYPKNIKYIAVYYIGYGGIKHCHSNQTVLHSGKVLQCQTTSQAGAVPYIVPLQTNEKRQILCINEKIIHPLRKSNLTRLFLFHCCCGNNLERVADGDHGFSPAKGEIIAFATFEHQAEDSQSTAERACAWTRTLYDKISQEDKPLLTVLRETSSALDKKHSQKVYIFTKLEDDETRITVSDSSSSQHQSDYNSHKSTKSAPPTERAIFNLLRNKSANWDDIGREFNIELNYRDELRTDISRSHNNRLEAVIANWMERNHSQITWEYFSTIMGKLEYEKVIGQLVDKGYIEKPREYQKDSAVQTDPAGDCTCDDLKEYSHHWERLADELEVTDNSYSSLVGIEKLNIILKKWSERRTSVDSTSMTSKSQIQKPISIQAVYSALRKYSHSWSRYAYELEVDDDYRDTLEDDDSLSDEEKLRRVITQWIEKGTCEVSLEKIITASVTIATDLETERLNKASKLCLIKPSARRNVIDCLKHKASCWNDLAEKLKISNSFVSGLKGDDHRKLEKVIKEWLDESKGYEPTWEKIIEAVKEIPGLGEGVRKLEKEQHLDNNR